MKILVFIFLATMVVPNLGFANIIDPLDSLDVDEVAFWGVNTNHASIVTDPVTGTGSVMELRNNLGLSHTFDKMQDIGTISIDMYMPVWGGSHQNEMLTLYNGQDTTSISAQAMITNNDFKIQFFPNGNVSVPPLNMADWHTFSISLNGLFASEYIDGILYDTKPFKSGFQSLQIASFEADAGFFVKNFEYQPAVVPEPSSFFLFSSGLLGTIGFIIRKMRLAMELKR